MCVEFAWQSCDFAFTSDTHVRLYNSKSELASFEGHSRNVRCVAFSRNDAFLFSGGEDSQIIQWDVKNKVELNRFEGIDTVINRLLVVPSDLLLVSCSFDGSVRIWDLADCQPYTVKFLHSQPAFGLDISADGRYLFSAGMDGLISIWDFTWKWNLQKLYTPNA